MSRHVDDIASRLSLRAPQRRSLEILDQITRLVPLQKEGDLATALDSIRTAWPEVTDFERNFPSLCFGIATGVGKTRLMGAFVAYLHRAHGVNNFFVLAPNLTIYRKLIADFTPNTPKYVLKGIAEFAAVPPVIVTGDNYEHHIAGGGDLSPTTINIFNISKINAEVRGGRSPRIRSFRETIGESYFDHLAAQHDLVLIMDESHRYRASAGVRALNELKPALGIELTATPFVETPRGAVRFRNIVFEYPLAKAIADGFVKVPAVVTRENFSPAGTTAETIERIKLDDGVRLHESVKAELETYARQAGQPVVKPFMLVIARDTAHAAALQNLIRSEFFFAGRYTGKVIQVDSSVTEEETVTRLLAVERTDEPTEIVIHVNMLKEGWDVTNLYTIVPLRAANARTLIEQSIGRGLRLPYGQRTGVPAVDRLNIVAHDRFQEIVEAARRPDSPLLMQQIVLPADADDTAQITVVSQPHLLAHFGRGPDGPPPPAGFAEAQAVFTPEEQPIAALAHAAIRRLSDDPALIPGVAHLARADIQNAVLRELERAYHSDAGSEGMSRGGNPPGWTSSIVARTADLMRRHTIDIPHIVVVPAGDAPCGFHPFALDLSALKYAAPETALWAAHLQTGQIDRIAVASTKADTLTIEDCLVNRLTEFDDVAYAGHADMLHDLARQVAAHLQISLSADDARAVMHLHQKEIAALVHAQMQAHFWQAPSAVYTVTVRRGFMELRPSAYTAAAGVTPLDFRRAPPEKAQIASHLFGGFSRCLYAIQKFDSDPERILAIVLDRESRKWFRPARGQFNLFYRSLGEEHDYQPDFVAETNDAILMMEVKAAGDIGSAGVTAKRDAAVEWCRHASAYAATHGGKPWTYVLVPHTALAENVTMQGLITRYAVRGR